MRQFVAKPVHACVLCLVLLAGCQQNPFAGLGWKNPYAPSRPSLFPSAGPSYANAPAPSLPSASPVGPFAKRWGMLPELQQRADAQHRLAQDQQRRLKELYDYQIKSEKDYQQIVRNQQGELRRQQELLRRQQLAYQDTVRRQQLAQQDAARRKLAAEQQTRWRALQQKSQKDQLAANRLSKDNRRFLSQNTELQRRASGLDMNNRDLHAELARSQKQTQLLEDRLSLLQRQLGDTANQLAETRQSASDADQRLQTITASARRRSGASITANNSLSRGLTAVMAPGLEIRQDGEVVRINLPAERLFALDTAQLLPGAETYVDQVANVILQNYPQQVIGIEAHTDSRPLGNTMWRSAHQLTAAQSMALFEQLNQRHRMLPEQLFVMGHGANFPLVSNATVPGQSRNRRVEIVIYPEVVGRR